MGVVWPPPMVKKKNYIYKVPSVKRNETKVPKNKIFKNHRYQICL
jgi:hypothetical protein